MKIDDLILFADDQRHLVCVPFSIDNLHRMAESLMISKRWFHAHPTHPHYDIPKRRVKDIMRQCIVVRPRDILTIIMSQTDPTLQMLIVNELDTVTKSFDEVKSRTNSGYGSDTVQAAFMKLNPIFAHHTSLMKIAAAAGVPTRAYERSK